MLSPRLDVVIRTDEITVSNAASGTGATVRAPFSCEHLLADDIDILEHAAQQALKQVVSGFLPSYPKFHVSTGGRSLHAIEQKAIRDALLNAGASKVEFEPSVAAADERKAERDAYIAAAAKRRG